MGRRRIHRLRSKDNLMGELTFYETPARLQVLPQVLLLFNGLHNDFIYISLLLRLRLRERCLSFRFALIEEFGFSGSFSTLRIRREESVRDLFRNLHASRISRDSTHFADMDGSERTELDILTLVDVAITYA